MFEVMKKIPLWVRPFLGLAMVVLGAVLALNSSASIQVFVLAVSVGLVVVGITRVIEVFGDDADHGPDRRAGHDALDRWITGISGALLIATGIGALAWRGATLPILALAVALLLLLSGVVSLISLFRSTNPNRTYSLLGGLASIAAGALVLVWPKLTVWAFGVFFGGWLVFTGLRLIIDFYARGKERSPTPTRRKLLGIGKIAGSALALLVAVAMVLVTSFIHAGDPRLVPDAFYTPPTDLPSEPGRLLRVEPLSQGVPGTRPPGGSSTRPPIPTARPRWPPVPWWSPPTAGPGHFRWFPWPTAPRASFRGAHPRCQPCRTPMVRPPPCASSSTRAGQGS